MQAQFTNNMRTLSDTSSAARANVKSGEMNTLTETLRAR